MPITNVIKAASLLGIGILYYRVTDRAVDQMQVPALKAELRKARALEESMDRQIAKRVR